MAGQPAWARYGRLQGALMATGRTTAEITARWAAEGDALSPSARRGDSDGTEDERDRRAVHPEQYHEDRLDAETATGVPRAEVGRRFILAGNAIVTLAGATSRYTFKIQQGKPREGDAPDRSQPFFLSLLTGPDNTADYQYIGIVDQQSGKVRLTRASRLKADSGPVRAWDWTIGRMFAGQAYAPATVHHAGRCGRCGRLLTVPSSIESGFGPECAGKLGE